MVKKKETFSFDSVYVVILGKKVIPVYSDEKGDLISVLNGNKCSFDNGRIFSFKEYVSTNGFLPFLYSKGGKKIGGIITKDTILSILKLIEVKNIVSENTINALNEISDNYSKIISKLLGLNYLIDNDSKIRIYGDITKVIIPKTKMNIFENTISNFIFAALLLDKEICLTENHYRIMVALGRANIEISPKLLNNNFSVVLNRKQLLIKSGPEIVINDQERGYSYTYKREIF